MQFSELFNAFLALMLGLGLGLKSDQIFGIFLEAQGLGLAARGFDFSPKLQGLAFS